MRSVRLAVAILLTALSTASLHAEIAELEYIDPITDLTGSCFPQGIPLCGVAPRELIEPEYDGAPLYGSLPLAGVSFTVVIDIGPSGAYLYADTDQSGVLQQAAWEGVLPDGRFLAKLLFHIPYEQGEPTPYRLLLIWEPYYPTVLIYCRGAYYGGSITLGEATYRLAVFDEDTDGRYDDLESGILLIDVDQDDALLTTVDSHEQYRLDEPFNMDGTVYRVVTVAANGSQIEIEESDEWVEEKPSLEVGHPAPVFTATDTGGRKVALHSLRGQTVVLDFWASWCAPCMIELPTMKAIAERFRDSDVAVLGINLDRSQTLFEQARSSYGIDYPQIYDGEDRAIASLYRIAGIPMTYVIDPDGTIQAKALHGTELIELIESLSIQKD